MKTKGLKILDKVSYGEDLCWCILWFDGVKAPLLDDKYKGNFP